MITCVVMPLCGRISHTEVDGHDTQWAAAVGYSDPFRPPHYPAEVALASAQFMMVVS